MKSVEVSSNWRRKFLYKFCILAIIYANYCLLEGAVKNISNPFGGIRGHYVSTNKRNGK